jgi:hypothetical protein
MSIVSGAGKEGLGKKEEVKPVRKIPPLPVAIMINPEG